jgi:hypothetical protein
VTTLWLDHKIFGNGYGMATPYFDGKFYWLSGELYTFMAGFGAQLHSYQWRHPKPGESRRLCGRDFRPFHSTRRGVRVEVAWATHLPEDIDAKNAALRDLERDLGKTIP